MPLSLTSALAACLPALGPLRRDLEQRVSAAVCRQADCFNASSTLPGLAPLWGVGSSCTPSRSRRSATLVRPSFFQEGQHPRLDPRLLGELVDDWRLEANLGEEKRVRFPTERVENDQLRGEQVAVCIGDPFAFLKLLDKCGVERGRFRLLTIAPLCTRL